MMHTFMEIPGMSLIRQTPRCYVLRILKLWVILLGKLYLNENGFSSQERRSDKGHKLQLILNKMSKLTSTLTGVYIIFWSCIRLGMLTFKRDCNFNFEFENKG